MSIATNYFEQMCLNPLRGTPATAPSAIYLALFLTNPGETGAGTEVSGGSYARQSVSFSAPASTGSGIMSISNAADIVFPQATAAWGTITYVALFDSLTAGNMLAYIQLTPAKEGINGATISFVPGELRVDATSLATTYYKTRCLNLFRGTSIAAITTTYVSLHTADPGETGSTLAEVTASPYARQAAAWSALAEAGGGNMTMSNTAALNFPTVSTISWGTLTHFGICDAATSGNMLFRGNIDQPATFVDGDRLTFSIGGLSVFAA